MPEATLKQFEAKKVFYSPKVIFVLCAAFISMVWFFANQSSESENRARFERASASLLQSLKSRMDLYTNSLVYTRNLLAIKPDLTKEEFSQFVRGMNLSQEFPGIHNFGYVKRLSRSELQKNLYQLPEKSRSLLNERKSFYDVVFYVENIAESTTSAIGMDLSTSDARHEAMTRAAELGLPVATERVRKISDHTSADDYFLVFVPHYKLGIPLETPQQRQNALLGFVYAGFRAANLFGIIAGDTKMREHRLSLQIFDGPKVDSTKLIFKKGQFEPNSSYSKVMNLQAADHTWTIAISGNEDFVPVYARILPLLVLLVGVILTLAVTYSVHEAIKFAEKLQEDIVIRRRTEAQLAEEKQIVELTSKIGMTLKAEQDLESIVQLVTKVARDLVGADFGEFREPYQGQSTIRIDDVTRAEHSFIPIGFPKSGRIRSFLVTPVISKSGKILGGLFFGHPNAGVFNARSEAIVQSLAIQAASAMDNATLYRELSQARADADFANQAKTLFLANVSHEIRTPLGLMLGFAELTIEHINDPHVVEENTKKILRNGRELTRIIGEVLDLSKIEANALLIEKASLNLPLFFQELKTEWQPQFESKNIAFEMQLPKDLPVQIKTDSTRMNQILVNLLSNALKFTDRGHVRIQVNLDEERFLRIDVEDTGIGISSEHKHQLFKTFSQGDTSINRRFGGSGLGLALSKQLAQVLGGELKLSSSELNVGSTFTLRLPIEDSAKAEGQSIPDRKKPPGDLLESVRILLVEDSIDNQILISTFLSKAKAIVDTANNGEEGVKKALSNDYSVVLMDIQMPVLDGYAAFQKLQAAGYKKPVIALTAHALIEEKQKAFRMGFREYLTKPVNRQALVTAISEALH